MAVFVEVTNAKCHISDHLYAEKSGHRVVKGLTAHYAFLFFIFV